MTDQFRYADAYNSEAEYFYDCYHPTLKEIYRMLQKKDINKEQYTELKELIERNLEDEED